MGKIRTLMGKIGILWTTGILVGIRIIGTIMKIIWEIIKMLKEIKTMYIM
jgi:hypothetical protein